jgi:hypothetical protein
LEVVQEDLMVAVVAADAVAANWDVDDNVNHTLLITRSLSSFSKQAFLITPRSISLGGQNNCDKQLLLSVAEQSSNIVN